MKGDDMALDDHQLWEFLLFMAPQVPFLLVLIVGVVMSLTYMRRYPGPALLALFGFLLYFLTSVVSNFLYFWGPRLFFGGFPAPEDYHRFFLIVGIGNSLFRTTAFVLFLFAIFGWRNQARAVAATAAAPAAPPSNP